MSLRNNLTKSISNISSNLKSKIPSVKMPSLTKSVKMPDINTKTISKNVSEIGFFKTFIQNTGTILLFMLIIVSLLILYQVFNTNLSNKDENYYDEKIYILKKKLKEGHENKGGNGKIPKHTGKVNAYCPGACFKWTTSDPDGDSMEFDDKYEASNGKGDNVSVCHRDGCCTERMREIWPDDGGESSAPWDWKTNATWQKNNKDWYCHCWLGAKKGEKCCESVISGVVVPKDDIFSNCRSGVDWGDGWSGFGSWPNWSSSDSTKNKPGMAKWMCETFLAKCWKDNECVSCYGSSGGGHGDKCSIDSDCKSNYCHPKNKVCDCPVSGMKGDDCTICDRDHPTNKQIWYAKDKAGNNIRNGDGSNKYKEINRCDGKVSRDQWYLNHAPKGDRELTNARDNAYQKDKNVGSARGLGIMNDAAGHPTPDDDNPPSLRHTYNGSDSNEIWEPESTINERNNLNKVPGRGKDTRGVGLVRTNADNEYLSTETWTHHKEGFKGFTYQDCFDKTKMSTEDQKLCKEWWDRTRKCSSFPPEFCNSKTPLGESKCLQYPCCLWEYSSGMEGGESAPKWGTGDHKSKYNRSWNYNNENRDTKSDLLMDEPTKEKLGGSDTLVTHPKSGQDLKYAGRCIKGTTNDGIFIGYEMKKLIDNYNTTQRSTKENNLKNAIETNESKEDEETIKKKPEFIHVDEYYYSEFKHRPLGGNSRTDYYRYLEMGDKPEIIKIDSSDDNFGEEDLVGNRPNKSRFINDDAKFKAEK